MQSEDRTDNFEGKKRSRWRNVSLVAAGSLITLSIWITFFAKRTESGTRLVYGIVGVDADASADLIAASVERRLRLCFGFESKVTLTDGNSNIQIDVPSHDPKTLADVDQSLHIAGHLRFLPMERGEPGSVLFKTALTQIADGNLSREVTDADGDTIGRWVSIDQTTNAATGWPELRSGVVGLLTRNSQTGEFLNLQSLVSDPGDRLSIGKWMADNAVTGIDALAIIEPDLEVGGQHLAFVAATSDQTGNPAIAMNFDQEGSSRVLELTNRYAPVGTSQHRLGIIVDDRLLSAPNILQPIKERAQITGEFSENEVQTFVSILQSGEIPITLSEKPSRQESIKMSKRLLSW